MNWYLQVLNKYADFNGRARRKEYWMFVLFNLFALIIAMILDKILGTNFKIGEGETAVNLPYGYIYLLYCVAILLPSIAVCVRRLHDIGKSGWMMLIALIPIIGGIWLLALFVKDSQAGENEYGLNPKEMAAGI